MFIWRDDTIGNRLANAILRAANRGVHVTISVDRVGMILEMCEESERSFFHTNPRIFEWFKIKLLQWIYPTNRSAIKSENTCSGLLAQLPQPADDYHRIRYSPVVAWTEGRLN
jgi:phosphatidylserine/phosphatidylglycerophosphate/cardiolipin synthase-like enzyme